MQPSFSSRRAFTLIELLVVISIIALLAAILFPVFGRVRERARQSACASNLKQVGLAVLQYAQDYDSYHPCGTYAYFDMYTGHGAGWATQLFPYTKSYKVFKCPDDSKNDNVVEAISYTGNANVFGVDLSEVKMAAPSRTVMATEMKNFSYWLTDTWHYDQCPTWNGLNYAFRADGLNNVWGGPGTVPVTGWRAGYNDGQELGVHSDGSNVLFVDGHVKWMRGQQISPGTPAANSNSAQVVGTWGSAAGTDVMTYGATFSNR